ncbi:hypothetical protein SEA_POKYPUPPY_84 [Gordonia phage PokyPuppy]|nr:hypothetical protein SEA_POKYPUPPY_84 [Gordonia phage PokyPuppy]
MSGTDWDVVYTVITVAVSLMVLYLAIVLYIVFGDKFSLAFQAIVRMFPDKKRAERERLAKQNKRQKLLRDLSLQVELYAKIGEKEYIERVANGTLEQVIYTKGKGQSFQEVLAEVGVFPETEEERHMLDSMSPADQVAIAWELYLETHEPQTAFEYEMRKQHEAYVKEVRRGHESEA